VQRAARRSPPIRNPWKASRSTNPLRQRRRRKHSVSYFEAPALQFSCRCCRRTYGHVSIPCSRAHSLRSLMAKRSIRRLLWWRLSLSLALLLTGSLFVASAGRPWLFGVQREPRWAFAIGSGRLKLWWAQQAAFSLNDSWTSSWYRGLDGQTIRWDVSISPGTVRVVAIPLWPVVVAFAGVTAYSWLPTRRSAGPACSACGYDRAGLDDNHVCPECGSHV